MTRLAAVLLALLPAVVHGQPVDLRIHDGERRTAVHGIAAGSVAYPATAVESLGGRFLPDVAGGRIVLFGDTIRVFAFSPVLHLRDALHQLAFPVVRKGGALYLPEQFFIEWLPHRYPDRVQYAGGVLSGTRAQPVLAAAERVAPPAGRRPARTEPPESASSRDGPGRARSEADPARAASRQDVSAPAAAEPAPPASAKEQRVVVVDAGHGGRDPGKIGPNGLREKELTLLLAKRLREELVERGYEVHLTRSADTLVALDDRPRLANRWKNGRPSALFLSIHANSVARGDAQGFETFFLSEARTEDERRVAEMENAAVEFEDIDDGVGSELDQILSGLRNDYYVRASSQLAENVQEQLAAFHTGPNRGVKRAGFRVLVGALMPAALIEVGFISNAEEARLLGTSAFQQKLVWGIATAVDRFFDSNEHLLTAGTR